MKRFQSGALLGLIVLLASSCGDDSEGGANRIFTAEQLESALLSADDLGNDWTLDMGGTFASRDEAPQVFDQTAWCPDALAQVEGLKDLASVASASGAAVEISQSLDQRRQFHGVSQQLWSNDQAERFVKIIDSAFEFCDGVSWDPGGADADEIFLQRLNVGKVGDFDAQAMIAAITPGPDGQYVWNSRTIAVRVGTVVMVLRELDVQIEGSDPFASANEWQELLDTALAKIRKVQ